MAVTRNDVDQVFGPNGQVLSSTPVVRDITIDSNRATIVQQAQQALAANVTYLGIVSPTNAQAVAQVGVLTRQMNGVIRLLLNQFDATT